jgi:hypothetical protein
MSALPNMVDGGTNIIALGRQRRELSSAYGADLDRELVERLAYVVEPEVFNQCLAGALLAVWDKQEREGGF